MTQNQREYLKQRWFRGCENIRETQMPSDAKFFVGQVVVHNDENYEVIGYYDYYGTLPHYFCIQKTGKCAGSLCGIPFTIQDNMYLKSEEHLHRKAKIIKMNFDIK